MINMNSNPEVRGPHYNIGLVIRAGAAFAALGSLATGQQDATAAETPTSSAIAVEGRHSGATAESGVLSFDTADGQEVAVFLPASDESDQAHTTPDKKDDNNIDPRWSGLGFPGVAFATWAAVKVMNGASALRGPMNGGDKRPPTRPEQFNGGRRNGPSPRSRQRGWH
jgi:hypothetical protein